MLVSFSLFLSFLYVRSSKQTDSCVRKKHPLTHTERERTNTKRSNHTNQKKKESFGQRGIERGLSTCLSLSLPLSLSFSGILGAVIGTEEKGYMITQLWQEERTNHVRPLTKDRTTICAHFGDAPKMARMITKCWSTKPVGQIVFPVSSSKPIFKTWLPH